MTAVRRIILVVLVLGVTCTPGVAEAAASEAQIAETDLELTSAGDAHVFVAKVVNASDAPLVVRASAPKGGDGCDLTPTPATLEPNTEPASVSVLVPKACTLDAGKLAVVMTVGTSSFSLVATDPANSTPNWNVLYVFPIALVALLVLALAGWGLLSWKAVGGPGQTLTAFDTKWSFKDAWAANVTVLGAVLTGVVGSTTVVKAILGADGDKALALAIVGVAIAAALAAAGPVVLSLFKWNQKHTVLGVVTAGAFVATAAVGELFVVANSGTGLKKVGKAGDTFIWIGAGGAALLLAVYLVRNTVDVVKEGKKPSTSTLLWPDVESTLIAATLQASQCCADGKSLGPDQLKAAINTVRETRGTKLEFPKADPELVAATILAIHCCEDGPVTPAQVDDAIQIVVDATADDSVSNGSGKAPGITTTVRTFGI